MMKKYAWAVVLLLALSLAFFGCGPGDDGGGGTGTNTNTNNNNNNNNNTVVDVETTVFNMSTNETIQALTDGAISFPSSDSDPSPIAPLRRAGADAHVTVEALQTTHKTLVVTAVANWGPGIDLPFAAFGFRAGDVVTITGEVLDIGGGRVQLNSEVGSSGAADAPEVLFVAEANGTFEWKHTLTAANITNINAGDPAAIRMEGRPGGQKFRIDNITVVGMRPSTVTALPAPVVTRSATGVSWAAVPNAGGYRIYNNETLMDTVGASATSHTIMTPGIYSITVVAVGLANVSSDSLASAPPVVFEVEEGGGLPAGAVTLGAFNITGGTGENEGKQGQWETTAEMRAKMADGTLTKLWIYIDTDNIDGIGNIDFTINTVPSWVNFQNLTNFSGGWVPKANIVLPIVIDLTAHTAWDSFRTNLASGGAEGGPAGYAQLVIFYGAGLISTHFPILNAHLVP